MLRLKISKNELQKKYFEVPSSMLRITILEITVKYLDISRPYHSLTYSYDSCLDLKQIIIRHINFTVMISWAT